MKVLCICSLLVSLQYSITIPLNAGSQRGSGGNDLTKAVAANSLATKGANDAISTNIGNIYSDGKKDFSANAGLRSKRELQTKDSTSYEDVDLTWLHESSKIIFNLDAVKKQILGTQKANIPKLANAAVKIQGVLHELCTVLKKFVKVESETLKQFENDLKDVRLVRHLFGNVTCLFSNESHSGEHEDRVLLSKNEDSSNASVFDTRKALNNRTLLEDQQKSQKGAVKNPNVNERAPRFSYDVLDLKQPKQKLGKEDTQKPVSKVAKDGKVQNVSASQASGNVAKREKLADMNSGITNITMAFDEQEPVQILP